jgi:pimeloyl-ACP methyl ester carboxylesterase
MEGALADSPASMRAEAAVLFDLLRSEAEARGLRPLPAIPTSVILAGKPNVLPANVLPFDTGAYARAVQDQRIRSLRAWVKDDAGGRFLVAEDAGHFVHADQPALVMSMIRELIGR